MVLETVKGGELFYHIRKCKKFSEATARYYLL
jgi:serine/threonine protein kinase